jgi:hypothetical protein
MMAQKDAPAWLLNCPFQAKNFMLKMDFIFAAFSSNPPKDPQFKVVFRKQSEAEAYTFVFDIYQYGTAPGENQWQIFRGDTLIKNGWINSDSIQTFINTPQTFILLAEGNRFAVCFGGSPVVYFEDSSYTGEEIQLGIEVSDGEFILNLDSLSFWDLDRLVEPTPSAGSFTEPILAEVAGRAPDFQDDFAAWNTAWGQPQAGKLDVWEEGGQMVFTAQEEYLQLTGPGIRAHNFVLQYDFYFDPPSGLTDPKKNAYFIFSFRGSGEADNPLNYAFILHLNQPKDNRYPWRIGRGESWIDGEVQIDLSQSNTFTFVSQDAKFAVLLNGELVAYFSEVYATGAINSIDVKSEQGLVKVVIDNLKFWKLR